MDTYVVLLPYSNTNPGDLYRVVTYRDYLAAADFHRAVTGGETFIAYQAARACRDELNAAQADAGTTS